jgi:hypothetical protein
MPRTNLILSPKAVSKDGPAVEGGLAAHLYVLRCADAAYYVGTTLGSRVEHSSRWGKPSTKIPASIG